MVLAAAGDVNHDDLVKLAEKSFSAVPGSPATLPEVSPCRYTGSEVYF